MKNRRRYPRFYMRREPSGRTGVYVILKQEDQEVPARWIKYSEFAYSFDARHHISRVLSAPPRFVQVIQ